MDEARLFGQITNKFYPHADSLVEYLLAWADAFGLNVRAYTQVVAVTEGKSESGFLLKTKRKSVSAHSKLEKELAQLKMSSLRKRLLGAG